jgi:acyl carrier protein
MTATESIVAIVREIVRARAAAVSVNVISIDATLESLGLDSIAIAETLLDCERRFGVSAAGLLDGEPLTVRALVEHLQRETVA